MARVKIQLPGSPPFQTVIPIRVGDLNYGGHLGNDAVLSIAHEARLRFLASRGLSEMDLAGTGVVMTDCAVQYQSQGDRGQRLRVEVGVGDVSRGGFDLYYRMTDEETGQAVATVKTGLTCFDYEAKKIRRLPEAARAALEEQ